MKLINDTLTKTCMLIVLILMSGHITFAQKAYTEVRRDQKNTLRCGNEKNAGNKAVTEVDLSCKNISGQAAKKSKNTYNDFIKRRQKNMVQKNQKRTTGTADKPGRQNKKKEMKNVLSSAEIPASYS